MHSLHTGRVLFGEWKVFPNVWWWLLRNLHVLGFFNCCEETPWPQHLLQRKHLIEVVAYSFRGSVHYHHDRKHGSNQTVVVLATCSSEAAGSWPTVTLSESWEKDLKAFQTMTYFFQHDHIYSNKATPPNSAILFGDHFLSNHHIPLPDPQRLIDI